MSAIGVASLRSIKTFARWWKGSSADNRGVPRPWVAAEVSVRIERGLAARFRADQLDVSLRRSFVRLRDSFRQGVRRMLSRRERYAGFARVSPKPGSLHIPDNARQQVEDSLSETTLQSMTQASPILRNIALSVVASASRAYMTHLNDVRVLGGPHMIDALHRAPGQGLITVSNHVAALDDPLVLAQLLPGEAVGPGQAGDKLRWTLCATDRCFKNGLMSAASRTLKILPVDRGAGIEQGGMKAAAACLQRGEWVHIFPEGTRGAGENLLPMRAGVGKLVHSCWEAGTPLLVVPFVHVGMQNIMPRGRKLPATGQKVTVVVGEPIDLGPVLRRCENAKAGHVETYRAVAAEVGKALGDLKAKADWHHQMRQKHQDRRGQPQASPSDVPTLAGPAYPSHAPSGHGGGNIAWSDLERVGWGARLRTALKVPFLGAGRVGDRGSGVTGVHGGAGGGGGVEGGVSGGVVSDAGGGGEGGGSGKGGAWGGWGGQKGKMGRIVEGALGERMWRSWAAALADAG